ncbi:MAG: hypothetical protein ACKVG4_11280 [Longimicrobiales bacterium]|jgi:hypothetical protein
MKKLTRDHVWPVGITVGLSSVVAVNVEFIVLAVSGQDEVESNSMEGER